MAAPVPTNINNEVFEADCRTKYSYDDLGNMTVNDGTVLAFDDPARPHILTSVDATGLPLAVNHDVSGRRVSGAGIEASYTSFDLPQMLNGVAYGYDALGSRAHRAGEDATVDYVGGLFERREVGGETQNAFIVAGPERPVAEVVHDPNTGLVETYYLHDDHLGSIETITDESGAVVERYRNHPFGNRERIDGAGNPLSETISGVRSGFTLHENEENIGVINMGGRIYDPTSARFLTADPYIGSMSDRNYANRYSYVANRPLTLTDPTGYFISFFGPTSESGDPADTSSTGEFSIAPLAGPPPGSGLGVEPAAGVSDAGGTRAGKFVTNPVAGNVGGGSSSGGFFLGDIAPLFGQVIGGRVGHTLLSNPDYQAQYLTSAARAATTYHPVAPSLFDSVAEMAGVQIPQTSIASDIAGTVDVTVFMAVLGPRAVKIGKTQFDDILASAQRRNGTVSQALRKLQRRLSDPDSIGLFDSVPLTEESAQGLVREILTKATSKQFGRLRLSGMEGQRGIVFFDDAGRGVLVRASDGKFITFVEGHRGLGGFFR